MEFLSCYFGIKYCDIFNYISDGPIKCDFFRSCLIYIYGGIYVDADIEPLVSLENIIFDDVDFVTCVSYNYNKDTKSFNYNPHFIVSRKYNVWLYNTIKKYESMYDNKVSYSYWHWSICYLFNIKHNFEITIEDNLFIKDNKKYQFLIENCITNNVQYNFTNILDENGKFKVYHYDECICTYENKPILSNFANKKKII